VILKKSRNTTQQATYHYIVLYMGGSKEFSILYFPYNTNYLQTVMHESYRIVMHSIGQIQDTWANTGGGELFKECYIKHHK